MTKTVYFHYVRHGMTLFNKLGRMQGRCDSPLLKEGIGQAYEAKEDLKDVPLSHAYCSSSERCVDTAAIVLEGRNVPITYTKELKEMSWGDYEGALISAYQEEIDKRRFGNRDWSDVGGENPAMMKKRITDVFSWIFDQSADGDHILIVSHGAFFICMLKDIFKIDLDKVFEEMRKEGKSAHPVKHGYAADFLMKDGVLELLDLKSVDLKKI